MNTEYKNNMNEIILRNTTEQAHYLIKVEIERLEIVLQNLNVDPLDYRINQEKYNYVGDLKRFLFNKLTEKYIDRLAVHVIIKNTKKINEFKKRNILLKDLKIKYKNKLDIFKTKLSQDEYTRKNILFNRMIIKYNNEIEKNNEYIKLIK